MMSCGARRTFLNGSVQPSEIAKLAVVIYVSTWVASKGKRVAELSGGLIPFGVIIGLVTSLIILEPNFSTAIVVLTIGIAIFFVGGADVKQLVVVGIIGAVMLGLLMWQYHTRTVASRAGSTGCLIPLLPRKMCVTPWS